MRILLKYFKDTPGRPGFSFIGFDADEERRVKISVQDGFEKRYPLIEAGIGRAGCEEIIKKAGLPVPMKSGCFFCPFQRIGQIKALRKEHPSLFCQTEALENRAVQRRIREGKTPIYIKDRPIEEIVRTAVNQRCFSKEDEYPPCQCGH